LNDDLAFTASGKESDCGTGNEKGGTAYDAHRVRDFAHISIGDHDCGGRLKKGSTIKHHATECCQENAGDD
jgi:hypothetical protein